MPDTAFAPGTAITNRDRLWRVDAQMGDVLIATCIDGGEMEQQRFYLPFEDLRPGRLDLVDIYVDDIAQFPALTRDQERWLGIAMECPKLILDNAELGLVDGAVTLDIFFAKVIDLAAREGRCILRRLGGTEAWAFPEQLDALIQEVRARREDNRESGSSVLAQLMEWSCAKDYDHLYNLCGYLWALPTSALQFLSNQIRTKGFLPSARTAGMYRFDDCGKLAEEIREIRRRAEKAKEALILHNLRLVTGHVWRYRNQGLHILDLYQEGSLGLISALDGFDYRQGNRFSACARYWIRQSISRAVAEQCRAIPLPAQVHDTLRKIHSARDALREDLRREPTTKELAERCAMSHRAVRRALNREPKICSLDSLLCCSEFPLAWLGADTGFVQIRPCPIRQSAASFYMYGADDRDDHFDRPPCMGRDIPLAQVAVEERVDYSMLTLAPSSGPGSIVGKIVAQMLSEVLDEVLDELTNRERLVIEKRFGLADGRRYTLEEVGEELGVTRERVRQLEAQALKRLRSPTRLRRLRHHL